MKDKELLEKNTKLSNEVIKPILDIIDKYFFVCFEDMEGNKDLMIPNDNELIYFENLIKKLQDRSNFIDNASCVISAYGRDSLRESQKAKEIAEIGQGILNLAKIRTKQVKNAIEYQKSEKNKDKFLKDLGIF